MRGPSFFGLNLGALLAGGLIALDGACRAVPCRAVPCHAMAWVAFGEAWVGKVGRVLDGCVRQRTDGEGEGE